MPDGNAGSGGVVGAAVGEDVGTGFGVVIGAAVDGVVGTCVSTGDGGVVMVTFSNTFSKHLHFEFDPATNPVTGCVLYNVHCLVLP